MSTSPTTILITINTSWNIYNFRKSLIERLRAEGYRVITAAPDDAHSQRLAQLVDAHFSLPMSNAGTSPIHDALLWLRYMRLLRAQRPDIILAYTIKPNIYGTFAAAMLGIATINNVSGLGTAFIRRNWLTRVVSALYRAAFSFSSRVFFQNPEDRDLFVRENLVQESKTGLLAGSGINLQHFAPDESPKNHDNNLRFILIARMLWDKGIGEYIEAARIIKQQHLNVNFMLLGPIGVANKTAISQSTIDAWQQEGVVEYIGESDDVREAMRQADCVVLPSYREGMSRVLLEASAMGKPLIATDVPGCKHIIDHEKNGLLCRLQDASDLAHQIQKFIEMTPAARDEMSKASRKKAEDEFDEQKVLDAYLHEIKALL